MQRPFVLHVGLVKAASSTLQHDFFARHSALCHLGAPWHDTEVRDMVAAIVHDEIHEFDASRWRVAADARRVAAEHEGKIPSLSSEAFTMFDKANRIMIAERLCDVFGDCKVVIVLRNQLEWLASRYVHQYLKPVPETRLDFPDWLFMHWKRAPFTYRSQIDYLALVRAFAEVFGGDNVGVFLMEQLASDHDTFVREMCAFMGIDGDEGNRLMANKHREPRGTRLGYMRRKLGILPSVRFSEVVPRPIYGLAGKLAGGQMNPVFPAEWIERINEFYRPGNRRLAKEYRLPLEEFGYPV